MSALSIALGGAVIAGWALDVPILKSGVPGWVAMKPNDAVAFVLAGAALGYLNPERVPPGRRLLGLAFALAVALLAGVSLAETLLGWDAGIDRLLFGRVTDTVWTSHPGRMAPASALAFLFLGTALLELDRPGAHLRVEVFAVGAILSALVGYLAHVYAVELLHGTGYYTHIAVHGAAGIVVLSVGVLVARPARGLMRVVSSDGAGGVAARQLLPAAIVLPPVFAWLAWEGLERGTYRAAFALALLSLAHVVAFGVVILRGARLLYALDAERALAEAAARRSRERIRLLVEGTRDAAILTLDGDGTVRSWNPGATKLYGYEEAEIVGQHFSKFFPPEDVVRGKPRLGLAIAAAEGRFEEEGWRVKKDGSRTWVSVIVTALVGEDGVLRGFGKIVRDRTERKAIEERLRLAQLQVIQADKMETVGRLAAGVAHEVKNPLATILGGIDFLTDRRPPDGVEVEVLREMRQAVDRANEIVVGLLDFSAPRVLALGHESVNRLIDRVLRFMKHQLDRGHVRVVRELTTGLPRISIDERKIEQVFVNVFLNALHAMPEGGTLTIRTYARRPGSGDRTSRMRRFFGGVAAEIVTEIEDTGPGIPEERLRRVFEPFFTSRPTGEGTGLGLTVCKAIVEMHGGSIDLANRDEGGARVTIVLNRRGEREHDEEAFAAHR